MPWTLLVNPALIAAAVAAAYSGCRWAAVDPHVPEMAVAAMAAAVASTVAAAILTRARPGAAGGLTQVPMLALVAHLGLMLALSLAALVVAPAKVPMAYWSVGLFWVTLAGTAGLCVAAVRVMARTPGGGSTGTPGETTA